METVLVENWKERFEREQPWGIYTAVDLKECNPQTIRDAEKIKQFVIELCELINMKRFGDCVVVNFGEDEKVAGFSMTQLIETSLISGHFANLTNAVYLDIFSCKYYEPHVVAKFAKKFFEAKNANIHTHLRK